MAEEVITSIRMLCMYLPPQWACKLEGTVQPVPIKHITILRCWTRNQSAHIDFFSYNLLIVHVVDQMIAKPADAMYLENLLLQVVPEDQLLLDKI